ncbi:MAG: GAF domain-containing protein, partial [Anaerolineae bacterium]|nr:GAF domain-containing protein [Anaerolineae bacterium]
NIQDLKTLYQPPSRGNLDPQQAGRQHPVAYLYEGANITRADYVLRSVDPFNLLQEADAVTSVDQGSNRELITPIQLNNETIGVLGVEDEADGDGWTADDIRLLEEVSSQVGLAVENSRLLQQTQQRTKELSILYEATRQLTETIDLTQIYEILTTQIINYLTADTCSILLLNEARTHFELGVKRTRSGQNGHAIRQTEPRILAVEEFEALQTILKNPDVIIEQIDDPHHAAGSQEYLRRQPEREVQTLTRFPLIVRSKLVAIMEVEHWERRHDYSRSELQLAQAIIAQVTVAIENAQLFQQIELALSETQNLYEISRSLVESTSVSEIFDIVLRNVKVFDVDRVSISLLDRSRSGEIETVTIAATWDSDPDKILPVGTKFSADNFALVHTFAQPPFHPLISENLAQSEGQDERMDEAFRNFVHESLEATTLFSAPMFLGAEYKGVLSIYTRKAHTYTEQEIRIYQNLADQAIIAIENHRLLEATRRERDRASMLYELGQTLSSTTTVDEVSDAVLASAAKVGATGCEIYISDGGEFVSIASTTPARQNLPLEKREASAIDFLEKAGVFASAQREKVYEAFSSSSETPWPPAGIPGLPEVGTFTCIPFYSQRSTLQGVISFFHEEVDAFNEDQLATFDSVAIQTATSLENVWLLRQTNIVLSETELLYKATTGFNSAQTFEDLLMVLVDSLTEFDVDRISVGLIPQQDATDPLDQLDIVASWHRQTGEISTTAVQLPADQYSFVQEMRPNAAKEIHYNKLDVTTQANIDQNLGRLRTILSIPLAVGQNWLGALLLASQSNDFVFKVNTINQIFNLAGQAAVVIQNLQLVEETQKNLFNSEILSTLGQELLIAETPEAIYEVALAALAATKPDRGAAVLMYDQLEGGIDLELVGLWNNPAQTWPAVPMSARFSAEELGLEPLLKTGETVISDNAVQDERFSAMLRQLLALMQINVMVAVPLWINKDVGGFMLVGNQSHTTFSADTIRLYQDIARQASGALENRRLFDEAQYRAKQLETAAEVSQVATSYLDLDVLLPQSVELIRKRFGFYHVSIFLVDDYQRNAVVEASTGEIGQQMLAIRHKLEVGGRSIVGTATGTGKPRIALDVGKDAVHFNNPLLPDTRSEMALPLIAQGRVIGALDVQSTAQGAFSESDINILQSMANQLANAIEAARAIQKSSEALAEVSKLHEHYLRDQWGLYLKEEKAISGYQLTDTGLVVGNRAESDLQPEANEAIAAKEPIIVPVPSQPTNGKNSKSDLGPNGVGSATGSKLDRSDPKPESFAAESGDLSRLIAPLITLKGRAVIGTVDFELPEKELDTVWDNDTQKIVEAVTSQAAQAIEAARLFKQTRIAREEAEALYDVGRSTVRVESEREMFNTVLGKLLSTLGMKQGGILIIDEGGQTGTLCALFQDGQPVDEPDVRFPIAGNLSYERLIESKRPV